ncbi:response regulator transcription factor [Balneolales bacterium ANBcel1]|nr:response regulator transcription factor [Balneolales bacterium ANBcel1]
MSKTLILVVDDEHDILELVEYNLIKQGHDVIMADNGADGILLAEKHKPNLILLDIMMPKMDGHQVLSHLKSHASLKGTPVIFLTAKSDEETEVKGLDQGADDYLTKPISISKLMSRIKAVLRRVRKPGEIQSVINVHDLQIDREKYVVLKGGKELHLPRKEFELLFYLAGNKGKVLSRETLLNNIWGNVYVVDRTVDVHVRKIREKLGNSYIETVKGIGYRFKNESS